MITTKFLINNYTYKHPIKIKPEHIITHSSGGGVGSKDNLHNAWNKYDALSVQGMVDDIGGYKTLPFDILGYHVGKKGNSKTIGFEICEPKNIAYVDKNHTKIDTTKYDPKDPKNIADFNKRYANAVEMAVEMCKETGLPSNRVISHAEGYKLGVASNHGDVEHWFTLFGKSMDDFRRDVEKKLKVKPNVQTGGNTSFKVKVNNDTIAYTETKTAVPKGVYTITEVKGNMGKLKSGVGWVNLSETTKL